MARFVALYRLPQDGDPHDFLARYHDSHVPLVARTPGLTRVEISAVRRTVKGEPLMLMAVMHFADEQLTAALGSPEWAEVGRNLAEIGGLPLVTLFTLEEPLVLEPAAQPSPHTEEPA